MYDPHAPEGGRQPDREDRYGREVPPDNRALAPRTPPRPPARRPPVDEPAWEWMAGGSRPVADPWPPAVDGWGQPGSGTARYGVPGTTGRTVPPRRDHPVGYGHPEGDWTGEAWPAGPPGGGWAGSTDRWAGYPGDDRIGGTGRTGYPGDDRIGGPGHPGGRWAGGYGAGPAGRPGDQRIGEPSGDRAGPGSGGRGRRRRRVVIALVTVGAGVVIGYAVLVALGMAGREPARTGGGSGAAEATGAPATRQPEVGLGEPVRDGNLEFSVQGVRCGIQRVGAGTAGKTAQGRYCLATVAVRNVGQAAGAFDTGVQKARGVDGVSYGADSEASLYANVQNPAFGAPVQPGARVTGVVAFDMPAGATLSALELHESAFSPGALVRAGS